MSDRRLIPLDGPEARDRAREAIGVAPKGHVVVIRPPNRSLDQSAKFHAICHALAKSGLCWAGRPRDADEWKFLLVSAHGVATKEPGELLLGLEQERVMLRESTAAMSVSRMSSLIEYAQAFCAGHGVEIKS